MKKLSISKFTYFSVLLIAATFSTLATTSCSGTKSGYGPIFYNIKQEVSLEKPVVTGNVYSMVHAGAFLYTCNGYIYFKPALSERGWNRAALAEDMKDGNYVIRLAATDGYLYALTRQYRTYSAQIDEGTGNLFNWKELTYDCATFTLEGNKIVEIFDNDADYGTGTRRAFYSGSDGQFYELKAGLAETTPLTYDAHLKQSQNLKLAITYIPVHAAYISNSDITVVSNDMNLTSDRTTFVYHMEEDVLYFSDDGENWNNYVTFDSAKPLCIAYYTDGFGEWVYVGKKAGVEAIILNRSGIPSNDISSSYVVGKNTTSCLGDNTNQTIGLFPYPIGSGNLYASTIVYYSSKAASNTNKLWGYYPTRFNGEDATWNCE